MLKQKIIFLLVAFVLIVPALPVEQAKAASQASILITEVQTGGWGDDGITEDPLKEFVELYNPNPEAVNLSGWQLQFLTSTHTGGDNPTRVIADFNESHIIEPLSLYVVSYQDYITSADFYYVKDTSNGKLAKSGGSVRLVNQDKKIVDIVGYGTALQFDGAKVNAPSVGASIQRCSINNNFINTNNNKNDFSVYSETTPGSAVACVVIEPDPEPEVNNEQQNDTDSSPSTDQNIITEPQISCEGLIINEILPNPAGTDVGREYIEIYNPTNDYISLIGCKLQTTANTKIYTFEDEQIPPGDYRAFFDSATGLTLPNSAGGTVYLISSANQEISTISYPVNLADDVAWANFNGDWQQTYIATPAAENILQAFKPCPAGQIRNPDTNRCINEATAVVATSLQPCPAGQERNPATNRCRIVTSTSSTLTPCKPGQIRNPDTNRCRNVTEAFKTLTPCKLGQERNPATNRCRNIIVATALKPCPAGQERNPDTGRCRKVLPKTSDSLLETLGVSDVPTSPGSSNGIVIAILTASGALAYGLWGWRQDISNSLYKLRNKQTKSAE